MNSKFSSYIQKKSLNRYELRYQCQINHLIAVNLLPYVIMKEFKQKQAVEERASGIEVVYREQDQWLQDIMDKTSEYEGVLNT